MGGWKLLFWIAAAFNVVAGLPMLLAPADTLAKLVQPVPESLLTAQLAAWLIVVFGLGYAMVARDPQRHRGIVWMGVVGKAPIALLVWLNGGAAALATPTFLLALGDLVFVALFLAFLLRTRPA